MAQLDLGRLGFVNKGTYNNSTTYEKNDLVQFTDGGILSTYLYIDSTANQDKHHHLVVLLDQDGFTLLKV